MSASLRTLRRQVALAWIMLLALLPQLVVKSLHYHDSVPTCTTVETAAQGTPTVCLDCLREAAAQAARPSCPEAWAKKRPNADITTINKDKTPATDTEIAAFVISCPRLTPFPR